MAGDSVDKLIWSGEKTEAPRCEKVFEQEVSQHKMLNTNHQSKHQFSITYLFLQSCVTSPEPSSKRAATKHNTRMAQNQPSLIKSIPYMKTHISSLRLNCEWNKTLSIAPTSQSSLRNAFGRRRSGTIVLITVCSTAFTWYCMRSRRTSPHHKTLPLPRTMGETITKVVPTVVQHERLGQERKQ
jgi:hypothetical protein